MRIGGGRVDIETLAGGHVRMTVTNELGAIGRQVMVAEMAPVEEGTALRLLREESTTTDESGTRLGSQIIDHARGEMHCSFGPPHHQTRSLLLPEEERLIMVPGNLLLRGLVEGDQETVSFQVASCKGVAGRHFINVRGQLAKPPKGRADPDEQVAKVDVRVDLGRILNRVVVPLLPRVSFWFDAENARWLGHRIPTYSGGPTILLVRNETTANALLHGTTLSPPEPTQTLEPARN